ncbi:hypothetical protein ACFLUS_05025 [Chloroflexota bacterium]
MATGLSNYLDIVRDNLRLDPSSESEVINELECHIEDRLQELKGASLSEEEATSTCEKLLGSAKMVAHQIYEAHSQGTWKQALLASTPYLLFALNWWQGITWLPIMLILVLGTTIYGWFRGKPTWLFPWLGYTLVPVVTAGLLLLYLPEGWTWLAILIYIPLALWFICTITIQTIKRDWLFASLMLLPVSIIIAWVLAVDPLGKLPAYWLERINHLAPWIRLSFLALGLTVAAFVRLRQRWLRAALLIISGLLTLIMVTCYAEGRLNLPIFLALVAIMLGLLLIPAILERKIRYHRQRPPA